MVVGLDPSTVTGWCLPIPGGATLTGEWDGSLKPAAPTKGRAAEGEGIRFLRIYDGLAALLDEYPEIGGVIYEHTHSKSKRATEVLGGVVAVVLMLCEQRGLDYLPVPAPTLKAFGRHVLEGTPFEVGGRGLEKEAMRVYAESVLHRDLTDNEADAWWLTRWYRHHRALDAIPEEEIRQAEMKL